MEPLLQISHLTKIFSDGKEDEYKAVDDVSFELSPGEKLAIIGESGSGKTTVVNMITRLLDSTDGKILLDGEDITHYKRNKMTFTGKCRWFFRRRPKVLIRDAALEMLWQRA